MQSPPVLESTLWFADRRDIYKTDKPFLCHFPVGDTNGSEVTNLRLSPHTVAMRDLRTCDERLTLENSGFEWVSHDLEFEIAALQDSRDIRRQYAEDIENFLKDYCQASFAFTFETKVCSIFSEPRYK